MKSNIKIYGPPMLKSLKALEALAIDTNEVCIMDTIIAQNITGLGQANEVMDFFGEAGNITLERCSNIISKSGEELGDNDFYFEWFVPPTMDQVNDLIQKIDDALAPLGSRYTITTSD